MKKFEITATLREQTGKKATKQVRKNNMVPCVMYGGKEIFHFQAEEKQLKKGIYTPEVYIMTINLNGKQMDATVKEIQFHPVSDKINHIDFIQVFEDKPVTIAIPVKLNGFAQGVKDGGILSQDARKLTVKALPKFLPDVIDINIDNIKLGQSLRVKDLNVENLQFLDMGNKSIASVKLTRASKDDAPAAAGAATA